MLTSNKTRVKVNQKGKDSDGLTKGGPGVRNLKGPLFSVLKKGG